MLEQKIAAQLLALRVLRHLNAGRVQHAFGTRTLEVSGEIRDAEVVGTLACEVDGKRQCFSFRVDDGELNLEASTIEKNWIYRFLGHIVEHYQQREEKYRDELNAFKLSLARIQQGFAGPQPPLADLLNLMHEAVRHLYSLLTGWGTLNEMHATMEECMEESLVALCEHVEFIDTLPDEQLRSKVDVMHAANRLWRLLDEQGQRVRRSLKNMRLQGGNEVLAQKMLEPHGRLRNRLKDLAGRISQLRNREREC